MNAAAAADLPERVTALEVRVALADELRVGFEDKLDNRLNRIETLIVTVLLSISAGAVGTVFALLKR